MKIRITGRLSVEDIVSAARCNNLQIEISDERLNKIKASRAVVDDIVRNKKAVYGITTGFGKFADVSISEEDCKKLQRNIILSHASGVGKPFDVEIVRAMMLLRINALSIGNSGISLQTLGMLISLLENDIIPLIPSQGSLGASGDLAPLSHMVLPMFGIGEVIYKGEKMLASEALHKAKLQPIELTAKEGLALINGTQAMNAIACHAVFDAENILKTADIACALTMEAFGAITDAFDDRLHKLRGQSGQIQTAANILGMLSGSKRTTRQGDVRVQDPYTIRCTPQVHGASKDAVSYIKSIVSNEINAVTDNPLIFPESGDSISGGNFHGQYLSSVMDFLAITLSSICGISERRTERLVNPQLSGGLPAFLVKNGGLNSGFMIPQYVAAALVSENKVLSHPASVDSITSSANQEDYVSMGMTAARKARQVVDNAASVLAIELFTAAQAIDLREGGLAPKTAKVYELIRKHVPFLDSDRFMSPDIEKIKQLITSGQIAAAIEKI